jgi:hypothetical protein
MKKLILVTVLTIFVGLFTIVAPDVSNAAGEFCMSAGLTYRISWDQNAKTFDIHGVRFSGTNVPIAGGAYIEGNGDIIIAFSELFNWGTGGWTHPIGTAYINYTQGTYDTTYHGDSAVAPINVTGTASVVPCPPGPPLSADGDPNAK